MITGPIALAFTAGMVAAFNPCGFSLLPAYIGAFVSGDRPHDRLDQRVRRAIWVAAAVSVGFIIVFASIGLIIDQIASGVRRQLPWVTITIGGMLVLTGAAMTAGWKPTLAIRGPSLSTQTNSPRVMVGYGVTYAVASLSCTIGPFLAVTGTALSRSTVDGLAAYVAYALGMGSIILVISVASAATHTTLAHRMRGMARFAPRVGGLLMMAAGVYAIWYGRWELDVYDGDLRTDPVIEAGERIRLWFVNTIESIGAQRIGLLTLGIVAAILAMAGLRRTSDAADPTATPPDAIASSGDCESTTEHEPAGEPT